MKLPVLLLMWLILAQAKGQDSVAGVYRNFFGGDLTLSPDSTFEHYTRFDLSVWWTKGEWKLKNDTIYLHIIPVYDTVNIYDGKKLVRKTLIVSVDETPEAFTQEEYAQRLLTSGRQEIDNFPRRMYYKKGKIFIVKENGRLERKKIRGLLSNKKFDPWYIRKN